MISYKAADRTRPSSSWAGWCGAGVAGKSRPWSSYPAGTTSGCATGPMRGSRTTWSRLPGGLWATGEASPSFAAQEWGKPGPEPNPEAEYPADGPRELSPRCGKLQVRLYLPPDGERFVCPDCGQLSYAASQDVRPRPCRGCGRARGSKPSSEPMDGSMPRGPRQPGTRVLRT